MGAFVFPSDMEGDDYFSGANNTNQPHVKLTFYQWSTQNKENNVTIFNGQITNEFFLAIPETTIMKNFAHKWDTTFDWTKSGKSVVSGLGKMFKDWAASHVKAVEMGVDFLSASTGQMRNDFIAESYGGLDLRRFEFLFNLIPLNQKDAVAIKNIITALEDITVPDYEQIVVKFPDVCDIQVFAGNDKLLFKTMLSGVEQLSCNYSPAGFMKVFEDGEPTQVQITLTIKELRRVTKKSLRGL